MASGPGRRARPSSQLVSTHTGLTLCRTSSSRRRISAGRPTRLWRSLIEDQRAR
jgi:hypothetical protein